MINQNIESITENILNKLNITSYNEIDIVKIANFLNVDVKPEDLDVDISGLFVIKGNNAYIRYNDTEIEARQRFTIAHELGHFILHKNSKLLFVDKSEKVMYRNFDSSTGEIRKEREANAFAASLLMPKKFILLAINNIPSYEVDTISYLAKEFKVSEQAMNFRLANLGLISLY